MFRSLISRRQCLCIGSYSPNNASPLCSNWTRFIQKHSLSKHIGSTVNIQNSSFSSSYIYKLESHHNCRTFSSLPPHEIIGLPALSPSVEESKIIQWKKKEGDLVKQDEAIASIQTDKAELDWQVTDDVYLAKILLNPDITVPIGTPSAIFVEEKKDVDAFKNYDPTATSMMAEPAPGISHSPSVPSIHHGQNFPDHRIEGMPALSPTAIDGAVVEWLVKEGDKIEEGSGIAEIQTDKSVVTWTAVDDAYIAKLLVPVGADERLPVGTPVAIFVDEKEDINAFENYHQSDAYIDIKPQDDNTPNKAKIKFRYGEREKDQQQQANKNVFGYASPYAQKLAKEMGITLDTIGKGSGPNGRIIANDIIAAKNKVPTSKTDKRIITPTPDTITANRTYDDIPVSVMRDIIAQRLSESKFSSPHFYVTMECLMDNLIALRQEMNIGEDVNKISVNDLVIKACSMALREVPDANVGWIFNKDTGKSIIRKYNYIDISVAVATPTGLITPIIKDVDRKTLTEISMEMKDLGKRAKENKLLPEEFQGGTFTISNMGMYGISNFTAIINPPQSCILAIGGTKKILKPSDNANGFINSSVMEVTLSSDHRSVDGALAAEYVKVFQKYIEKPAKMLM